MRPGSSRWHEVSQSEFAHEREGLALVRDLLPDRAPYRAWSNFEFRDGQGKWHEVDLLVLGEGRLHLVELKHYRGTIAGTSYRWLRDGRSEDSPLLLARRKAQRLASVIREAARVHGLIDPDHVPYVQEAVFLHAKDGRCLLAPADAVDLFGRDGLEAQTGLPSIADRLLEPRAPQRPTPDDDALAQLFDRIGFAVRREREVGSWRLVGPPIAEGEGWQDWPAEHRLARDELARIRFFVSPPGSSEAARAGTRQLVQREFTLTSRLQHDGVLRPVDLVEDDLGVGLVYPHDESARRLDLWMADQAGGIALHTQVDLIRQLAEAVAYAHRREVVHRGLSPAAVQITQRDRAPGGEPVVRLGDWQVAGLADPSDAASTHGTATRVFRALEGRVAPDPERRQAEAYLAPEGRWNPGADRIRLDVFALGAVAYYIVAGFPPASDGIALRDRVTRDSGLDLVADVPEVSDKLRQLVLAATRPTVSARLADAPAFLALLDDVDREVTSPDVEVDADPLEAAPGTLLGERFELRRRLGSGSTAVGLLVADRAAAGEQRVLKVALDDSAVRRLLDEAEVLRTLSRQHHPRIVQLVEEQPLQVGSRTALLLESAGERTLADELRARSRLSLDLLERWGTDLLEALVGLDKAGVDHRDIKPANLGIREQRADRAKHLVLFDFSLARAGAASLEAGTPPYLDPFLGSGTRSHWDSAAERYAAAVTLFEMATGRAPVFGDGRSDPAVISDEVSIEPGVFDPTVAAGLVSFFRRALRRDVRERFHTAGEMLTAWRAIFTSTATTIPDDADDRAAVAQIETPLAQAGLSARALSALEPFHVTTAGDLAALDPGQLSRLTGIADPTRREVRSRAKQWRERFGAALAERTTSSAVGGGEAPRRDVDDPLGNARATAAGLERSAGSARATARRHAARVLLGLEGDADPFATMAELAGPLRLGGAPQVSLALAKVRDAWAADAWARRQLDEVTPRVEDALADLGGLAWADDVVAALTPDAVDPSTLRLVAGLVRAALDRADDKAKGGGDPSPVARRRRRNDGRVLLAAPPELAETAAALAATADTLVADATAAGERVVPLPRAAAQLRSVWPRTSPSPDDMRLVRMSARLSNRAAASRRGELHDRDLNHAAAAALALTGLAPSQRLSVDDVLSRVKARFPELPPLPGRPRLDQVLADAGLPLAWDGQSYAIPSHRGDTSLASRTRLTAIPVSTGAPGDLGPREDAQLAASITSRSFLALGVDAGRVDAARDVLVARHGAATVDVTAVLIEALREQAARADIPWDDVRAADAAQAGTRPAQGLAALVARAAPTVEQAVTDAAAGAPEGTRPVLLVDAAPLALYGHTELLARLADITTHRTQAVWLLLPVQGDNAAALDGVPVPLAYASQLLRLDSAWLQAPARRAAEPQGEPA